MTRHLEGHILDATGQPLNGAGLYPYRLQDAEPVPAIDTGKLPYRTVGPNHPANPTGRGGYFKVPTAGGAPGWYALHVHLGGRGVMTDPFDVAAGPVTLRLAGEVFRATYPGASDGRFAPRPAQRPEMGFLRTDPPTDLKGGSLIQRGGRNTFFGFSPRLNILSDRAVGEEGLRNCVRLVHTLGGNACRQLRNLGTKHRHPDFVHSRVNAAEHAQRLGWILDECRERGVYFWYDLTDQPNRNRPEERGQGYDWRRDGTTDGEERVTAGLIARIAQRELGAYRLSRERTDHDDQPPGPDLGDALLCFMRNEPWEDMDPDEHGRAYDEEGKRWWRNRWAGNAQHGDLSGRLAVDYDDGTPVRVHLDSAMRKASDDLRDVGAIVERCQAVSRAAKGKPVVLDGDGARMLDRGPSGDAFRGLDGWLELAERCGNAGIGLVPMLTEPWRPEDPFVEVDLGGATFLGRSRWTTADACRAIVEAWRG